MENTKNLENDKAIKCPECGADGTATGIKTPDGRLPMYRCDIESCGAIFTAEDWLNCGSCHQQGELTSEVTDDGYAVCLCKNPACSEISFAGRKVEEVQVSYTSQLTGDEVWDVCPTCGKVGRNTGEVNTGGRTLFMCENEACPESEYPGGMVGKVTAQVERPFDWRKKLDVYKEIMEGCMNAANDLHPDHVDESLAGVEYTALCNMRSDCALAFFRVLTAETAHIMDVLDKAAAMLEDTGKNQRKVDIMVLPKGMIPMPPTEEQC